MAIRFSEDFKDFLKLLNSHQVKYLVVGGFAVGIHGYPRYTGDLDIWVSSATDNAERLVNVLEEFGFDLPEIEPELFQKIKRIIRMGYPPDRIELFTTLSGVNFDECFDKRDVFEIEGIQVNVIGFNDLITNKKAAGRHRDLDDVEHLT